MDKIIEFLKVEANQALLLIVFFAITFTVLDQGSMYYMRRETTFIETKIDKADLVQDKLIPIPSTTDTSKINYLKAQYYMSKHLKKYFMSLAATFNSNYFKFSVCFTVSSILLSIAIFLIVQKGWSLSQYPIKVFFIASVFTSSLYYFLPLVFNNKDNVQKNIDKVKIVQGIQTDIVSYYVSFNNLSKSKQDTVIVQINNRIKDNYDFWWWPNCVEIDIFVHGFRSSRLSALWPHSASTTFWQDPGGHPALSMWRLSPNLCGLLYTQSL